MWLQRLTARVAALLHIPQLVVFTVGCVAVGWTVGSFAPAWVVVVLLVAFGAWSMWQLYEIHGWLHGRYVVVLPDTNFPIIMRFRRMTDALEMARKLNADNDLDASTQWEVQDRPQQR